MGHIPVKPDFVVCPDKVAGGAESLAFSLSWVDACRSALPAHTPVYLVTQDGMPEPAVAAALDQFDGLFVGGTVPWKVATGETWVQLAHGRGKPCHIGRAGTPKRVAWAKRIGADSIDSCGPLFCRENLAAFVAALSGRQLELWS